MRRRILTCALSITSSVFNILCYVQKHVQTLMDSGNEEEDTYMCLVHRRICPNEEDIFIPMRRRIPTLPCPVRSIFARYVYVYIKVRICLYQGIGVPSREP
jgi:hypothetical protein